MLLSSILDALNPSLRKVFEILIYGELALIVTDFPLCAQFCEIKHTFLEEALFF